MARRPSPARCPRCASPLVEIHLAQGGRAMRMRSCSTCDTREWEADGERTRLGTVLDLVAAAKK